MKVLVMVVMEDAVRLPGLPPERLKGNPGVVNDAVIVNVEEHSAVKCWTEIHRVIYTVMAMTLTGKHGDSEHRGDIDGLDIEELHGVDGRHWEGGGLLVCVVKFVEVLKLI